MPGAVMQFFSRLTQKWLTLLRERAVRAAYQEGRLEDAVAHAHALYEFDLENPWANFFLASHHLEAERYSDALHHLERVQEEWPDDAYTHFALGICHDYLEAPRAAAKSYRRAVIAAPEWAALAAPARGEYLRKAADILAARADAVAADLMREEGKSLPEAKGETLRGVALLRYYAAETMRPDGEVIPSASAATWLMTKRVPLGVVSLITPWNFPIAIPLWKAAPAPRRKTAASRGCRCRMPKRRLRLPFTAMRHFPVRAWSLKPLI